MTDRSSPQHVHIDLGPQRSLHFLAQGRGDPLVLIHGALATLADWRPDLRANLAVRRRVLTVDRPGHGRSRRPRFAGAARRQAQQMRAALKLDAPAVLVAHSYGAMTALAYAEQYPAEVKALVLIAPICMPEPRFVEHTYLAPRAFPVWGPWMSQTMGAMDHAFFDVVTHLMFAPRRVPDTWRTRIERARIISADAMVSEGEDASAIAPLNPSAHLQLTRIDCPIVVIIGDQDCIVRNEHQGLALAALKRAVVLRVPHTGHMTHECAPHVVLEAVAQI